MAKTLLSRYLYPQPLAHATFPPGTSGASQPVSGGMSADAPKKGKASKVTRKASPARINMASGKHPKGPKASMSPPKGHPKGKRIAAILG